MKPMAPKSNSMMQYMMILFVTMRRAIDEMSFLPRLSLYKDEREIGSGGSQFVCVCVRGRVRGRRAVA